MVLGIYDGTHDAGAAMIYRGRVIAACNEERFNRQKGAGGWPSGAILACLEMAGVGLRDVDHVAFAGLVNPNPGLRAVRRLQQRWRLEGWAFYNEQPNMGDAISQWLQFDSPFPRLRSSSPWVSAYSVPLRWLLVHHLTRDLLRGFGVNRVPDVPLDTQGPALRSSEISLHDHHRCHAAGAYHTSGRDRALVVVVDGIGDGIASSVWRGDHGTLTRLGVMPYPDSYGLLAATLTGFLGFRPFRHEGKLTALAGHGDADAVRIPFPFEGPPQQRRFIGSFGAALHPWLDSLRGSSTEDLCAWLQRGLEQDICGFVDYWARETGIGDVTVAGGVFANVQVNRRIAELPIVESLYVFPHMGDGGLAVGAALLASQSFLAAQDSPATLDHVFLGPSWSPESMERLLSMSGLTYSLPADLATDVARRLADGQVVARFDGAMEFGPRALGNRSILAPAEGADTTETLNRKLRRTQFMPFAPLLLADDADDWVEDLDPVRRSAEYMTVALPGKPPLLDKCPGAIHVDGTLRPQLVDATTHPGLYAILKAYRELTGRPAIINTSFNLHEEPIVCSPADALRSFRLAKLDALILGPFLVLP